MPNAGYPWNVSGRTVYPATPDYFREVAAIVDATVGGPPDLVAIGAVMRRHGLTPAP